MFFWWESDVYTLRPIMLGVVLGNKSNFVLKNEMTCSKVYLYPIALVCLDMLYMIEFHYRENSQVLFRWWNEFCVTLIHLQRTRRQKKGPILNWYLSVLFGQASFADQTNSRTERLHRAYFVIVMLLLWLLQRAGEMVGSVVLNVLSSV